ncbi:B-box zinc finger protein 32-like [Magnolia sinica]|uniref:B-box zinc finger protein 32-like n=1 Tax=Magnolia sinica TaxID=86752 RepID=UPI00265AFDB1|nr:B-box zinc finger protein 32-like [Magnolia sinica]
MKSRVCELCNGRASLYCESDSAFLCFDCDRTVHEANFLVARHVRRIVCRRCGQFDGDCISGVGSRQIRPICRPCVEETGDSCSSASSSSSACISTAESVTGSPEERKIAGNRRRTRRISRSGSESAISSEGCARRKKIAGKEMRGTLHARAEGILVIWARRLGLSNRRCLALALHSFGVCLREFTVLPFRACLASSLWFAVKASRTRGSLKKLVECSGVPAKLILLVESKLSRIIELGKSDQDDEEGWAECSD